MKKIKITSCDDAMMWYSDKVGETVPYLGEEGDIYWSREDAGFKNRVNKEHGKIIEV